MFESYYKYCIIIHHTINSLKCFYKDAKKVFDQTLLQ